MKEAAKLLEGYHDFRTFMGKHLGSDEKDTRKVMEYININAVDRTGYSSVYSWPSFIHNNGDGDEYLFIDVYLKSKSFLYKQVRENENLEVNKILFIFYLRECLVPNTT